MDGQFTHKAQDAIVAAQSVAQERGQQQIDALHLLLALLNQEESLVLTLLKKMGIDTESSERKGQKRVRACLGSYRRADFRSILFNPGLSPNFGKSQKRIYENG